MEKETGRKQIDSVRPPVRPGLDLSERAHRWMRMFWKPRR